LTTLEGLGYAIETDWRPARVELAFEPARWVDLHPVRFADDVGRQADGKGGRFEYPPGAFTIGRIGGHVVPCLSAEQQLRFRSGYALRDVDRDDIALLVAATAPAEIRSFRSDDHEAVVELSIELLRRLFIELASTSRALGPH
jgi:hypothetical protein